MAELARGPIEIGAAIASASQPDCGAIVLFLGTTRDHHEGRRVTRLAYEAYEPMALAALASLEEEARRRFAIGLCRIVHRLGDVPVGEASVLVLVAAPHRAAAYDASRWAMDEVKRVVPIWKKETYADGGEGWAEGTRLRVP